MEGDLLSVVAFVLVRFMDVILQFPLLSFLFLLLSLAAILVVVFVFVLMVL
jgi:hypothetical protein